MLDKLLLDLGAPILAKVIGQRFGKDAEEIAQVGIEALASSFGLESPSTVTRDEIEALVKPGTQTVARKVAEAEARMPELLLAHAELQRARNEQQKMTNELLLAAQRDGKPAWTWGWLYAWQWFLMFLWAWTLVLVHLANAGLRLTGDANGLPAPSIPDMLTLTTLYLGLHMGGHTVLELMRGKWGRTDEKGIE